MTTTVTLLRRTVTGQDSDGNDTYTTASVDVGGCVVWPRSSTENVQDADLVIEGLNLLFPFDVAIAPTDQVIVDGLTYDVDGQQGGWESPFTGWAPGRQVALTRATG